MQPLQAGDPRTVGPYVLIARLGSGGMGHVFLGRTRGGRTVAVKAVKPELADDPEFRRRFRQEVAAARSVSGRYTAAVVDADPDAAMPWLATAYVSGQTLRAAVGAGWRLPEASLLVLAGGLARALAEIHAAGVVHRDLKPSNVILAVDGPRVIDFGISRVTAATDFTRTDIGTIVGSPGFMSPEQSRGHALTGATDVFSLGTVLAYAATGRNPFGAGPDHALLYRIGHEAPDLSGVPDRLVPLVRACLEKDPARRPSTAQIVQHTAAVPDGPWLPAALTAEIAQNAAEILDYEGIAVFAEPDTPATGGAAAPIVPTTPTLVMPFPDRPAERVGVGEPPAGGRGGGGGAGWVIGLLALAVIAALSTALVLVLRSGTDHPGPPPAASVSGTSTGPTPLTRSGGTTTSTTKPTGSTPSPTATSNTSQPTTTAPSTTTQSSSTPSSTTAASSTPSSPSSTPSTTPSSTPSSTASSTASSPASHSAPPSSASASGQARPGGHR